MSDEPNAAIEQLQAAVEALEAQRGILGDAVVEAALGPLNEKIAALRAAMGPEQQRKVATVLFMDMAGHTGMVQHLDPEVSAEIIDRALVRLAAPVGARGGHVVRYQGDGFKAVFGLPQAQENDPDNAVLAGLDILRIAAEIAAELERERGLAGFRVRVGINTGLVLAGGGAEGEDAVSGLTVNLAARLEQAAAPGECLISHNTYRHVRGVFDLEALEPIAAKGFPEPVPVYRVLQVKPRSFRTRRRGVEGVETRMIGRDAQLRLLQETYRTVLDQGRARAVTVIGEAGLGKSRLMYEFENWVDLHPALIRFFRGRARLEMRRLPYSLLRDLFVFRFDIHDDDPPPAVRRKLAAGFEETLGPGESAAQKAELVGHLLGYDFSDSPTVQPLLDDAQRLRRQAVAYLTDYFRAAAADGPVLMLLEDLHWADDSSLEVLAALLQALRAQPVMILGATRPSLYERHPDWPAGEPLHRPLRLDLLSNDDTLRLVKEILQRAPGVPDELCDLIVRRAEGNPFYVEELIKVLIDDGVIVKREDDWQISADRLADLHVPATLTGILQARIESLPPAERETLQRASVVGRLFWDEAVQYMAPALPPIWQSLRRREIIFPHETSAFEGATEYLFEHALLRDVVYESVLRRLRRQYHARAAEWLIRAGGERADEHADLIAGHFALAGDGQREAEWRGRAGKQAAARYALDEALRSLSRALELTPASDDAARFDLLHAREHVYHSRGARAAQAADLDEMEAIAARLGDPTLLTETAIRRSYYHNSIGDSAAALAAAQEAARLAEAAGDGSRQASAHLLSGMALWRMSDYGAARVQAQYTLALAQAAGNVPAEIEAMRLLAVVAEDQGDYDDLERWQLEALRLSRETHHPWNERRALNSIAVTAENRGDFEKARRYFDESLRIAEAIGDRSGQEVVLSNLGTIANHLGDFAAAYESHRQSLELVREIGDRLGESSVLYNLGWSAAGMGDYDAAVRYYEECLGLCREVDDRSTVGYALTGIGHALNDQGRPAEAVPYFRQALELRRELGQPHLAAESQAGLVAAYLALGDLPAALAEAEAVAAFLETGSQAGMEEGLRVMWIVYQALDAAGDGRAPALLDRAYNEVMATADRLDERRRRIFLDVSWNRAIAARKT